MSDDLLSDGLWREALEDRPKATRILQAGPLERFFVPSLFTLFVSPSSLFFGLAVLIGATLVGAWLFQIVATLLGVVVLRIVVSSLRWSGQTCSLCGQFLGRHDKICPECEAELL